MNNAVIAILLSALSYSVYPLLNAFGLMAASPITMSLVNHFMTMLVSFIMLAVLLKGWRPCFGALSAFMRLPNNCKVTAFFSAISVYMGGVFFLYALTLMSKAGATVIMEMWPILAIFISAVLIHKKWAALRVIDMVLMAVCVLGIFMITAAERQLTILEFLQNPFFMFDDMKFEEYIGVLLAVLAAYCFAFSGVSRAQFLQILPFEFKQDFFKSNALACLNQNVYIYLVTYIISAPLAILLVLVLDINFTFSFAALPAAIGVGIVLTLASVLYSLALVNAVSPSINILWYVAPVMAALWLAFAGFTQITPLLVLGAVLIIAANIILIMLPQNESDQKEIMVDEDDRITPEPE